MNYRRSSRAQHQRLLFLAIYLVCASIATLSATAKNAIGNGPVTSVTATLGQVCASSTQ
jgi:hypothetical protein